MQTPRKRSYLVHGLLLVAALLFGGCNSDGGDDGVSTRSTTGGHQAQAALVGLPTRGALTETGRFMDLAIHGDGMFVLSDPRTTETVYSRFGAFDLDHTGALIDSEGRRLMGQATPVASGAAAPIAVPLAPIPRLMAPRATTRIDVEFNLDLREQAPDSSGPFDPNNGSTYNSATSVTVYDDKGLATALNLYFRRSDTAADTWAIHVTADGLPMPPDGRPAVPEIQFDLKGIVVPAAGVAKINIGVDHAGMPIELVLDMSGSTQFGSSFSVTDLSQDGYAAGHVSSISFSPRGFITAAYDNGRTRSAGQVLLAKFTVADRFSLVGEYAFGCNRSCAKPVIEVPGVLLLGTLLTGSLEVPR